MTHAPYAQRSTLQRSVLVRPSAMQVRYDLPFFGATFGGFDWQRLRFWHFFCELGAGDRAWKLHEGVETNQVAKLVWGLVCSERARRTREII